MAISPGTMMASSSSVSMTIATSRFQKPTYSIRRAASGELDELLAKIVASQQPDQPFGCGFDSLEHRFAVLELSRCDQLEQRGVRLGIALEPIEHDHPLHLDAVHQDRAEHPHAVRLERDVGRNQAADNDPRLEVHQPQQRV